MQHDGALELGMFLGGLLMALPPIAISIGLAIWVFREHQRSVRARAADPSSREEVE
jgi:hypothetical protein